MSEEAKPELHLFVIWSAARHLEDKILADMRRHLEIVWQGEFPIEGRARDFYRRFYAHMRLDGKRKAKSCGKGPYLLVIVRDANPEYVKAPNGVMENRLMLELKTRYREWAIRGYKVHGTLMREEFARDVRLLTGHTAEEWERGIPEGAIAPDLPPLSSLPPVPGFLERWWIKRNEHRICAMKKKRLSKHVRAAWWDAMNTVGAEMGLADCRVMLENKLVNDIFFEGTFKGTPCIVKCSSRAPESIANEYEMSRSLAEADPGVCADALAVWRSEDGRRAFVVLRKLPGPSLTDMLVRGVDDQEALDVMDDMLRIAEALQKSGIVWRDIMADNLMKGEDGHLRLIDAQFAFRRDDYREDPYLLRNWRYRMLLFAHHPMMAGHGWNDAAMLLFMTLKFGTARLVEERRERLRAMVAASAFPVECGRGDMLRMRLMLAWMQLCRLLPHGRSKGEALRTRIARAKAFLSRDCGRWNDYLYR